MDNTEKLVGMLRSKDIVAGCEAMKLLAEESERTDEVYPYFDSFVGMLDDKNSYVRTRGLVLIAENAQWDEENKIDGIIGKYLEHITDEKPITARQCIKALPKIAEYKPLLIGRITDALTSADTEKYKDSMRPLILGDIMSALEKIKTE